MDNNKNITKHTRQKKKTKYYVYILASQKNGTLYIGVSGNIFSRTYQHKLKENKNSFTAKYNVDKLVHYETHQYINNAIRREKQLKKWKRAWKIRLIEENNPSWEDYFEYMK